MEIIEQTMGVTLCVDYYEGQMMNKTVPDFKRQGIQLIFIMDCPIVQTSVGGKKLTEAYQVKQNFLISHTSTEIRFLKTYETQLLKPTHWRDTHTQTQTHTCNQRKNYLAFKGSEEGEERAR